MSHKLGLTAHGDREIVITRMFDAPPHLVFDALTIPALLKRWFTGPDGWTLATCEIDLRVGGAYRYVWENLDGTRMGTGGLYREILSPERILQTEKYDDNWTGGETLNTATLTPIGDATRLTTTVVYPSREMRDAAAQSPMESGITIGYDRLDTVLAAVQQEQAQ